MERKIRLVGKITFWAIMFLVISLATHYEKLNESLALFIMGLGVIDSFWEQYLKA